MIWRNTASRVSSSSPLQRGADEAWKAILVSTALLAAVAVSAQPATPIVEITGGKLSGAIQDGQGVFKNIPFAAPPIGDLRWREPQAVGAWSGTRDGRTFGHACMQPSAPDTSEDCLTLNIWTPQWPATSKRAVMVWFHGGGNTEGWTNTPFFDGSALSKHGVVVVTAQYRLGVFGFLAHPELTKESPHQASGNYGLLDQIAALRWVKDNIAAFGGDPNNVTIFGESAGAEDVGLLLVSPLAKGLFHRAIAESGPLRKIYPALKQQEEECIAVARALNAPGAGQIAFLRSVRAQDLLNAGWVNQEACRPVNLDGYVLTDQPLKLYAEGKQHAVPFMLGNTLREGFVPMPPTALGQMIRMQYGSRASLVFDAYGFDGRRMPPPDPVYGDVVVQFGTDQAHRCRVMLTGLQHAQTGAPFYQFQFSRDLPGQTNGSTHTDEIPFVFGAPALSALRLARTPEMHLSEQMQSYWTNFAKTGDPNGPDLPRWSRFESKAMAYMSFATQGAAAGEGLRRAQCDLFLQQERDSPSWQ
jgi:para-nitrobenzyl esterase